MGKFTTIALISALAIAVLATSTAITNFTERTTAGAWSGTWTVDATKVTACKALTAPCCFTDSVTATAAAGTNSVVFTGPATGAGCATSATTLTVKLEGTTAESDLGAGKTVKISSDHGTAAAGTYAVVSASVTLLVNDGSANTPATYAVRLPAIKATYLDADAGNYVYLNTSFGKTLSASLIFIIALIFSL